MAVVKQKKAASMAGELVLVASPVDAGITGWDLATGAQRVHLRSCASGRHGLTTVGKHFVAASQIQKSASASHGSIVYWSWNKPQPEIKSFPVEPIGPVACNSTGTYIAGGGSSGTIYLWEVASGHLLRVWSAHYKSLTCLLFSDDDSLLISGAEDGFVKAWSLLTVLDAESAAQSETQIQSLVSFSAHNLPVTDIVFGYGGCNAVIVSASLDFTCKIWSLALGALLNTIKFPAAVNAVAVDPGEYAVYAGCSDGRIYVSSLTVGVTSENASQGGLINTLVDHNGAITSLAFSMDGVLLVSASEDCTVRVWDTTSCQILRIFKHPRGPVSNLIIVPHSLFALNANIQSNFNKRGSFLVPSPLNKYKESRMGNLDHGHASGVSVILAGGEANFTDNCSFHTLHSIKEQIKELQQQRSSASYQVELDRVKSKYQRSLNMIQQWQNVYQDLHQFCVAELMGKNKSGEAEGDKEKNGDKDRKGRDKLTSRK